MVTWQSQGITESSQSFDWRFCRKGRTVCIICCLYIFLKWFCTCVKQILCYRVQTFAVWPDQLLICEAKFPSPFVTAKYSSKQLNEQYPMMVSRNGLSAKVQYHYVWKFVEHFCNFVAGILYLEMATVWNKEVKSFNQIRVIFSIMVTEKLLVVVI